MPTIKLGLVILCFLSLVANSRAGSNSDTINNATNYIKAVTQKWLELLDDDKLPGLSENDHGKLSGFQLTKDEKKVLLDQNAIDTNMLNDVEAYKNSYVMGIVTTDNRMFTYLFYVENGSVQLVSAYHYNTNGWAKIGNGSRK